MTSGRMLRLYGRNLSFDIADTAQGVFLENEGGGSRKWAAVCFPDLYLQIEC